MGVGIVVQQVVAHRIGDGQRHLGAARPVEIGDRVSSVLPLQRGKVGANRVHRTGRAHSANFAARIGWIPFGSAFPWLRFMTCPTKKPVSLVSPPL